MPTENKIDCPAFHKRFGGYPYGDRVPRTVRMLVTVTSDRIPGVEPGYTPEARAGQTYPVWTNSHGAVTAVMEDGARLGLRPAEFEVDSWHHLAAVPAPQPQPEPIAWMVGTALWWTKEEAERDAAVTGLPIIAVGPIAHGFKPADHSEQSLDMVSEQHQGEPVVLPARREWNGLGNAADNLKAAGWNACLMAVEKIGPLYTRDDPNVRWEAVAGEQMKVIEQLRSELGEAKGEYDRSVNKLAAVCAQLAERDALLRECYTELLAIKSEIGFRGATLQLIGRIDHQLSAAGAEQDSKS